MSAYLFPIKTAVLLFPVVALVLALPFLIGQYRRYGSFVFWRAVILYTFIFYLLCAYFLIILPLPSQAAVAKLTTQKYNLVPFMALREFFHTTVFDPLRPATWLAALKQPGFIQPTFNIVLTVPFGVYLRYYFKRSLKQVLLLSFGLSLFFELTQLSGLYGIYVRPYRLFDVDDLLLNTLGGLIGGALAPAMMRAFPSRDALDAQSFEKGQQVTLMRRLVAFIVDNMVVLTVVTAAFNFTMNLLGVGQVLRHTPISGIVAVGFVHLLVPYFNHGATIGKAMVRIQVVTLTHEEVGFWRLALRAGLLYGVAWQSLRGFLWFFDAVFAKFQRSEANIILMVGFGLLCVFLGVNFFWTLITRKHRFFYDVWAKTMQVSTVTPETT